MRSWSFTFVVSLVGRPWECNLKVLNADTSHLEAGRPAAAN
jgi:hypothetical protein